jgi:hypothetical protein
MGALDERVRILERLASAEHGRCLGRLAAIRAREAAGLARPSALGRLHAAE